MKKYVNGCYLNLTDTELAAVEAAGKIAEAQERHRPYCVEEVFRLLLKEQLNSIEVDDQNALRMAEFYPDWENLAGKTAEQSGFKFTYGDKLYKTISANHTFSATWVPGVGTESLYARIEEEYAGDQYDPIPYEGNMELIQGFCYSQRSTVYRCILSTGTAVYHPLSEMVPLYVEPI